MVSFWFPSKANQTKRGPHRKKRKTKKRKKKKEEKTQPMCLHFGLGLRPAQRLTIAEESANFSSSSDLEAADKKLPSAVYLKKKKKKKKKKTGPIILMLSAWLLLTPLQKVLLHFLGG